MADSGIEGSHGSSLLPQSYSKSYMNKNNMMMTNENQYERTRNFYPEQTRHRYSVSNNNDSYTRDKSSFNANQEKTGIPTPSGPSSSSSFYSAPTTTNAVNFQYDVLLIYDPDTDFYAAQDLVKQIEHQQLRIFDFARDCPAGGAQRHFLEKAFETSRYICIVVTRNFISNFWLKFKTDMAIQFMLQNEHMHYSVIVVVMDRLLKQHDLPLDLQTLTPIFLSSPFYEIKISRAFGFTESTFSTAGRSNLCNSPTVNSDPSTIAVKESNNFNLYKSASVGSKEYSASSFTQELRSPNSRPNVLHSLPQSKSLEYRNPETFTEQHPKPPSYNSIYHLKQREHMTSSLNQQASEPLNSFSRVQQVTNPMDQFKSEHSGTYSNLSRTSRPSRMPQEHCDTPVDSALQSRLGVPNEPFQRMVSVTKNSNGKRQPTEVDDAIDYPSLIEQSHTDNGLTSFPNTSCCDECYALPSLSRSMNSIEISPQISDVSLPLPKVLIENHSFQASHFSFNKTLAENTSHVSSSFSFGDLEISDGDLNTSIPPMRNSLTSFCQYQNGSTAHSINMTGSMTPSNSTDKPLNATNDFSPCTEFSTPPSTNQHDSLPTGINTSVSIETDSDSGKSANQYGLIRTSITKLKRKFRKH